MEKLEGKLNIEQQTHIGQDNIEIKISEENTKKVLNFLDSIVEEPLLTNEFDLSKKIEGILNKKEELFENEKNKILVDSKLSIDEKKKKIENLENESVQNLENKNKGSNSIINIKNHIIDEFATNMVKGLKYNLSNYKATLDINNSEIEVKNFDEFYNNKFSKEIPKLIEKAVESSDIFTKYNLN